jgi:hypothetical protein
MGTERPLTSVRGSQAFQETPASLTFKRPLRRLTNAGIASTPHWGHNDVEWYYWDNTDNLEITLSLPQSAQVGCLRLVGIMKRPQPVVGRFATQGEAWGSIGKYNEAGDFKFSLVLSNDGFQKDIRKIDSPAVNFEETVEFAKQHGTMDRLPTWRIQVGQKATQIRILPRATTKERPRLVLRDLEVYEAQPVNELAAMAIAADINGDGANELVVGTSEKELAAFDANGKILWRRRPGRKRQVPDARFARNGTAASPRRRRQRAARRRPLRGAAKGVLRLRGRHGRHQPERVGSGRPEEEGSDTPFLRALPHVGRRVDEGHPKVHGVPAGQRKAGQYLSGRARGSVDDRLHGHLHLVAAQ